MNEDEAQRVSVRHAAMDFALRLAGDNAHAVHVRDILNVAQKIELYLVTGEHYEYRSFHF